MTGASIGRSRAVVTGRCQACEDSSLTWFGSKAGHAIVRCRACGSLTAQGCRGGGYEHYYAGLTFETPGLVARALDDLTASLLPYRETGRWIDVGFGEGGVLSSAERRGFQCHGIEVSRAALAHGRARGWTVSSALDDPSFPAGQFDVVTMIEVLEHLAEPRRFLAAAARWLRPGGLLHVTTPNADSLNRRCLGIDWSVCAPPEHLTLWTLRALGHALAGEGFTVVRARTHGCNPVELLQRLRGAAGPVDRNEYGRALNEAMTRSPVRRVLKSAINAQLAALRLGDTLKVWARRAR